RGNENSAHAKIVKGKRGAIACGGALNYPTIRQRELQRVRAEVIIEQEREKRTVMVWRYRRAAALQQKKVPVASYARCKNFHRLRISKPCGFDKCSTNLVHSNHTFLLDKAKRINPLGRSPYLNIAFLPSPTLQNSQDLPWHASRCLC